MRGGLPRLIGRRPLPYVSLVALWILLRLTVLVAGLLLQRVFDALAGGDHLLVWAVIAGLAANEAARIFLWYGVVLSRVEPGYTYRMRTDMQAAVVQRILDRPAATALGRPVGDVISRIGDDVDEVGIFVIWSASNVSRLVVASVALAVMLAINPLVTAALLVPVVAVTVGGRALTGVIGRAHAAGRRADGEVSTVVADAASGVLAVQVARAERRMVDRLRAAGEVRSAAAVRADVVTAVQTALFRGMGAVGTGLVLLTAAGQMRSGAFTVGDLALFVFYLQFVAEAVNALGMSLSRVRRANLSLDRLAELTPDAPVPLPPRASSPDAEPLRELRVTGLTARFPGSRRGVQDVSFTVRAGTLTVITGGVGAGKTTLLSALLGLLPADSGEISWNGRPVPDPAFFLTPPRTAYVPQVPRLFSGTIEENITLGGHHHAEDVRRACRAAALDDDLETLPDGLATVLGPRGLRLSGGQIQRVAAARALVREPQLLILDDLSNALDPATERTLWDRLLPGRTVLAVSHRPELIARADQVVTL